MKASTLIKILAINAMTSVYMNAHACDFSLKGSFQCYKEMDKKTPTKLLSIDSLKIDHFKTAVEIKLKEGTKPEHRRIYSLGKTSKYFVNADRDNLIELSDFYGESYTEFYENQVSCSRYEISIDRKYYYSEPDFFGTDGVAEEKIKKISGSHIEYTFKMTDMSIAGTNKQIVHNEKHFCFWK